MKKLFPIVVLFLSFTSFIACTEEQKADKSFDDFKEYITEKRQNMDKYYEKQWSELENEYNEKKMKAEKRMNEWSEGTKAEFASLQSDWDAFKDQYEIERKKRDEARQNAALVDASLPQGISADMSNVNASNLLEVHTYFVNYVEINKDEFSKEQWDRVENVWDALGDRKDQVEKDLKKGDNMKIAEQKLRYASIKAVNRPVAKAESK